MLPKRARDREAFADDLDVSSTPVDLGAPQDPGVEASVTVAAIPGLNVPAAMALASMRRSRRSESEEVWAQLYIDGVFVDVGRASEVESGSNGPEPTFVARFTIPPIHLDGGTHRARVCFVTAVSRVVPRGEGAGTVKSDLAPQAVAEADFVAEMWGSSRQIPAAAKV